ncbi:preprotein translocase subunit SecG [Elizabethkingia argentiflava]|uniref:Protein-export membrane protein SecG n=1 Tax=Elizabethkingia argenteiflava TaxID=2681556 RepID=A0A845PV53_9FLAO|nr:preprotein translocase subunit SecG [Elizabethkingia argenteiflava]NAW50756.1 preprotein translocase subunit SecG [Elizabethkingia argenteiflava]
MSTIFSLFMVLIIIACVLLIIIVMAQNPKGGGLSGTFGGSSSASFGVQRTNEFMDKATWSLGTFIVVLIMLSVILTGKPSSSLTPSSSGSQKELPKNSQAPVQKPETQTQQPSAK